MGEHVLDLGQALPRDGRWFHLWFGFSSPPQSHTLFTYAVTGPCPGSRPWQLAWLCHLQALSCCRGAGYRWQRQQLPGNGKNSCQGQQCLLWQSEVGSIDVCVWLENPENLMESIDLWNINIYIFIGLCALYISYWAFIKIPYTELYIYKYILVL